MVENLRNEFEEINDQIDQLKQQIEELVENYLQITEIAEQLKLELIHEMEQRENDPQDVQVISFIDKDKEVSAYVEENRSFIQSIWKWKK